MNGMTSMTSTELSRVGRLVLHGASADQAREFLRECALVDLHNDLEALERRPGNPAIRRQIEESYARLSRL